MPDSTVVLNCSASVGRESVGNRTGMEGSTAERTAAVIQPGMLVVPLGRTPAASHQQVASSPEAGMAEWRTSQAGRGRWRQIDHAQMTGLSPTAVAAAVQESAGTIGFGSSPPTKVTTAMSRKTWT